MKRVMVMDMVWMSLKPTNLTSHHPHLWQLSGPQSFRCTWPSSFSAFMDDVHGFFSIKKKLIFLVDIGDIFDGNYLSGISIQRDLCAARTAPWRHALRFLTPSPWRKRVHVAESTTCQAFNHHSPVGILEYRKKLLAHILQCLLIIWV